jgi:hypothetical protein
MAAPGARTPALPPGGSPRNPAVPPVPIVRHPGDDGTATGCRLTYLTLLRTLVSIDMDNHTEEKWMSTPTTTATAPFVDLAQRGQQAVTTATEATTRAFQAYAEAVAVRSPRPVDPQVVTTATFDLAEKLLRAQRGYVSTAVGLLTETGETVTAQASAAGETLKARTEAATERVVNLATEATRRAGSVAHNGVSA